MALASCRMTPGCSLISKRPTLDHRQQQGLGNFPASIGTPEVTFHALRHTHASQLIDEGVDIVTISKRLGHAKPDITLRIYAHLFSKDDGKAAAAINAALKRYIGPFGRQSGANFAFCSFVRE